MADAADDTILKTPRLVLRRFRESDFEDWFTHMNAPEVRHHLGGVDSRETCRERFDRQAASWSGETGGWLVIERKEDGALIGGAGFGPMPCAGRRRSAGRSVPTAGARAMRPKRRAGCWR